MIEVIKMSTFILDTKGYFLIKVNQELKRVEIAFLEYTDEQMNGGFSNNNKIKESKMGVDYEELLSWCEERTSRQDHSDYLKKELKKAFSCLKTNEPYVQS